MSIKFEFYTFSLDFFQTEILGSKSQDFIDQAYQKLLVWEMKYGEEHYTREISLDLYRYQLNLLVNEGKFDSDNFQWEKYISVRRNEWEDKEYEFFTKIHAIAALFTLQQDSYEMGGFSIYNYHKLFEDIQNSVPEAEQAVDLWHFLFNGRPLPGDNNFVFKSDSPKFRFYRIFAGPNYYGYLTNSELKRLFRSVELSLTPEDQEKLKTFSYLEDKTLITILDPLVEEFSIGNKDLFFRIS